jgi:hypothetical protein
MGRILLFELELLLLGIGVILATFQASGNDDTATKELMMWVSGPAMSCATILRYFAGSWSGPVDVSDLMPLNVINVRNKFSHERCTSTRMDIML